MNKSEERSGHQMKKWHSIQWFANFFLLFTSFLPAVDFEKDIRPIFKEHCIQCHGPDKSHGGLALHLKSLAFGVVDSGEKVIHPGDAKNSVLVKLIQESNPKLRMPHKKEPLQSKQINTIIKWINEGASWPEDPEAKKHWAYVKPKKSELPKITNSQWTSNAIDHFTLSVMKQKGLSASPIAEPAKLLRRLSLDLTGLPPEIADADHFIKNPSAKVYEKFVDQYLSSKAFGEKWARGWLDLARYADSDGYQRDGFRDIWLFRDYVINSMNKDLPFDQFTIEQIAGDLLKNPSKQQMIATAFHRNPILNLEAGTDPEEDRVKQVVDRVNTTGTVWLGTSMVCAQCHNHKYDPFSITEYYRMYAYFNHSTQEGGRRAKNGASMKYIGKDMMVWDSEEKKKNYQLHNKSHQSLEEHYLKMLKDQCSPNKTDPKNISRDKKNLMNALKNKKRINYRQIDKLVPTLFKKNKSVMEQHQAFKQSKDKLNQFKPHKCRVMDDATPRKTMILKRGNFLTPGPEVQMGVPAVLHSIPKNAPKNRLGLAQWLVSQENPLVARVTVNRWWQELFGHGIVASLDDFGKQGEMPSHPKLLDWLAVEFMEKGWSMKTMIKLMVMSSTYKQSTKVSQDKLKIDLQNRYFSRGNNFRYDAETIRDNALSISGLLSRKMGGPPVKPVQPGNVWRVTGEVDNTYRTSKGEDAHRRGIYTIWRRSAHYPSLRNFDAPNRGACTVKRSISNTPLQALTLLNDEAYVEMAKAFAHKIVQHGQNLDLNLKARFAFRTALARQPTQSELKVLTESYQEELTHLKKKPKLAKEIQGPYKLPKQTDLNEWAAWYSVATILLNCHETITRN